MLAVNADLAERVFTAVRGTLRAPPSRGHAAHCAHSLFLHFAKDVRATVLGLVIRHLSLFKRPMGPRDFGLKCFLVWRQCICSAVDLGCHDCGSGETKHLLIQRVRSVLSVQLLWAHADAHRKKRRRFDDAMLSNGMSQVEDPGSGSNMPNAAALMPRARRLG